MYLKRTKAKNDKVHKAEINDKNQSGMPSL